LWTTPEHLNLGPFQCVPLVHEDYLGLIHLKRSQWQNRAHFSGVAAQLMIRIDSVRSLLDGTFSADPERLAKHTFLRSRNRTGCGNMAILFGGL
jgi:hypothetical protein